MCLQSYLLLDGSLLNAVLMHYLAASLKVAYAAAAAGAAQQH